MVTNLLNLESVSSFYPPGTILTHCNPRESQPTCLALEVLALLSTGKYPYLLQLTHDVDIEMCGHAILYSCH